jgi:hypothetical protein
MVSRQLFPPNNQHRLQPCEIRNPGIPVTIKDLCGDSRPRLSIRAKLEHLRSSIPISGIFLSTARSYKIPAIPMRNGKYKSAKMSQTTIAL